MATFHTISIPEITLFLNDLDKSIGKDDATDFRKLTFYLFGFASARLEDVKRTESTFSNEENIHLLQRLISAIELVLTKQKHLLNSTLTSAECKLALAGNYTKTNTFTDLDSETNLLYEWIILYVLSNLTHFPHNGVICDLLKSLMIAIINLVTTKLHSFRHKAQIKVFLLKTFEGSLTDLFAKIGYANSLVDLESYYKGRLAATVHLFTIINDYDISVKLSLNNVSTELKLESFARKLWFLLGSIDLGIVITSIDSVILSLIDNLKSIIILNLTNNLIINNTVKFSQISLVASWIVDHIQSLDDNTVNTSKLNKQLIMLNRSISYCSMKVFILCIEKDTILPFLSVLQLETIIPTVELFPEFPDIILKTFHIIYFQYAVLCKHQPIVSSYQTLNKNKQVVYPFEDSELEQLRYSILDVRGSTESQNTFSAKATLLEFISSKPYSSVSNDQLVDESSTSFDYMHWLNYVSDIINDKNGLLDSRESLLTFINALGHFPCLVQGDYSFAVNECSICCGNSPMKKTCYDEISPSRKPIIENSIMTFYFKNVIVEYLLKKRGKDIMTDSIMSSAMLLTLFKIFSSFRPPPPPTSNDSAREDVAFKFIMNSLETSTNRDVRLLAGRILPLYLIFPKDGVLESSFKEIFGRLSSIKFDNESGCIYRAESTIFALGELATVSDGEILCALFIKLIDLFGETNEQHVNLVYCTFLNIAAAKCITPYKLLSPFLPSIAERIVKQPRMLLKITELLGVSKKYFLSRTKEYTTPRLLEYYKHDFIQEISDASGVTKWQLISKNLPRIIATYLCKNEKINETYIIGVLGNVTPEYKSAKMMDLMASIGGITWFILLQIRNDESGKFVNENQILNALTYVGKMNLIRNGEDPKKRPQNFDFIENLLGDHVLELVQRFSENVHHIKGSRPYLEKVSSLKAIEFLINRNITAASTALGQISTCLQATLENSDFQLPAITCWNVLVQKLETKHLISLFDIIISIIFQKFNQLEHRSKLIAVEILKKLFLELRDKYNKYALYFFSVPFVDGLDKYYQLHSSFRNLMRQKSKFNHFPEFTRRLQTGNKYVVQQALADLKNFTTKYQRNCQAEDFKDPLVAKSVSELLRTLLDTAQNFRSKNPKISNSCAKAISIIGALDPNKFSLKSIKEQVIVIHDFADYRENTVFLRHFMEEIVIKAFWASNNPVKQLFSAYSMQKFLEVLKLGESVLTPDTQDKFVDVWNEYSDLAKSTLTPLLSSKYISPVSKYEPLNYPFYKVSMQHEKWLIDFTSNLLKRSSQINKDDECAKCVIFQTCSMLVRDQDISICNYLLKYVSLSLVINGDESSFEDIKTEFLNILQFDSRDIPPDRSESLVSCFQSVFEVLDYFNEWFSVATQYQNDNQSTKSDSQKLKQSLSLVKTFLDEIPMSLIAIKSAECDSYERTILYLEKCYRDENIGESHTIGGLGIVPTLQNMYASINDVDALGGILKKFSTNNLNDKLATFQYNEDWSLAQESFQVLSGSGDMRKNNDNNTKLLASLGEHALYEEVLSNLGAKVDLDNLKSIPIDWTMAGLQASVGSANIPQLKKWIYVADLTARKSQDKDTLINYQLAKGLQFLNEGNRNEFNGCLEQLYGIIGDSLVSSMSSSFSRNSLLMSHLHTLYDLTLIVSPDVQRDATLKQQNEAILKERLANIDQSFESQWKILATHYVASVIIEDKPKTGEILLRCSESSRNSERFDVATRCIMKAMALNDQDANIEYSELLWAQGRQTEAIKSLSSIIEDEAFKSSQQRAKVQLQYAVWLDESNHSSSATIISEYIKAYQLESTWDKPYYDLGKYYSKIMASQTDSSGYYEQQTIRYFLKSLALGPSYIFEALPKLITIWLDFAQKDRRSKEAERKLNQIVMDIKTSINTVPIYVWYTSITQLLSRIGHSHEPSSKLLVIIISNLIQAYPKYSLWFALSHLQSNDKIRRDRVSAALADAQSVKPALGSIISVAEHLFSNLKKIANFKIQKKSVRKMSLSKDFGVNNMNNPCDALVIPVRSNLEIRLPSTKHTPKSFTAFPKSASVTFDGFDDMAYIFQSLQMPRQVTIRGSDFNVYRLMVKKDDTRKDAKVVEFTTMINRLLLASNETRKRNLSISNYAVVPLAENSGVIEFVQDVATMKSIISDQRKRSGVVSNDRKLFMKLDAAQKAAKNKSSSDPGSKSALVELFQDICRSTPPVLHHWLIHQFSDPGSWYRARTTFTRSSAVMSIVGYIIGLGDRHCENVLFFKKTGGVLHIDFDCLFDKGITLPIPEIVPFRLTQNLVDAMGITGIEGTFRITCEATTSLLRENEASLMNILETLLYDPLLDWKSLSNPEDHLRKVRRKIRGLVDEKEGLPMNVHGQVDVLIQEASSPEMLCQMYGGWAPYT
ncbi:serine/threonine-protein kinase Mec1p [[Candida] anglica]|uniref:Serine/threonine-protein kinase MEC1 n=1 Tax=[Candida] anglica TaxID=148631 RepID=A0ABP0EDQ9_9ASCO